MQMEVIKSAHDQGHFGWRKVEELIGREFFIPKLREKVQSSVTNCVKCILTSKVGKKEGYLHPIPNEGTPLNTYHIDHLGPMTETDKKYKYILTVVDAFTKFVWIHPSKTLASSEVIQKLNQQQAVFGNPSRIITDRGSAFTSHEFEEYCKDQQIEHITTTTGVPRSNGQVERIHRIIVTALTKLAMDNPRDWYKHTNNLQRFLNNSYQRSINQPPFELLFGTKMRNKEDLKLADVVRQEIIKEFDAERSSQRERAKKQIETVQQENRKYSNKQRKKATAYRVGDIVAIKKTQFGTKQKIMPKFLGPYRIKKVKGAERYDVEKYGSCDGPKSTSTCAEFMKLYVEYSSGEESEDESDDPRDQKAE